MPFAYYFLITSSLFPVLFTAAWDIAVITNEEIEFFRSGVSVASGHSYLKKLDAESKDTGYFGYLKELKAGVYDPVNGYLYVSDSRHPKTSIFRVNMRRLKSVDPLILTVEPVISKQNSVLGIAYDPISSMLYWTTGKSGTIMKFNVSEMDNSSKNARLQYEGTVVHQFDDGSVPRAIVVDGCNQILYWTNIRALNPSIEKSKTDGSQRSLILSQDNVEIHQPFGLFVDHESNQLYWCDALEGPRSMIVRSDLDGKNSVTIINQSDQKPSSLAIVGDQLYWSDDYQKCLYSIPKNSVNAKEQKLVKKFDNLSKPGSVISSILFSNLKTEQCSKLAPILRKIWRSHEIDELFITSHLDIDKGNGVSINCSANVNHHCLNNGKLSTEGCQCALGFTGARCEHWSCDNYCVNGKCQVDEHGNLSCKCSFGWNGVRCEADMCHNACFNDGQCSIDENEGIVCQCAFGFAGRRCEFESNVPEQLCRIYCEVEQHFEASGMSLKTISEFRNIIENFKRMRLPVCSCSPGNQLSSNIPDFQSLSNSELDQNHYQGNRNISVIIILAVICTLLGALVILLIEKVLKLRKRPRIKKRIVLNRPSATFCNPSAVREQCEITIENCCNMNICETPCFQPEFRSSGPTFNKKKSEDKVDLISAMFSSSSLDDESR